MGILNLVGAVASEPMKTKLGFFLQCTAWQLDLGCNKVSVGMWACIYKDVSRENHVSIICCSWIAENCACLKVINFILQHRRIAVGGESAIQQKVHTACSNKK